MSDQARLLYLIGQFPAINHSYLLAEVRHLRAIGFDVRVASVSPPDRPLEELSPIEREEAERCYYIKSVPRIKIVFLILKELLLHPLRWLRGLFFALSLADGSTKRVIYHVAYFSEAIVAGQFMREHGLGHLHASFSATVALLVSKIFPVTMSFGVYGFGELHDPSATHLTERIKAASFVRSISRHGLGQLMLSCDRSEWSKLIYVPLGIDVAEFSPPTTSRTEGPVRLLCVGRLAPEKGQLLLLEAVAALRSSGFPLELRLVGDGPDRILLEKRASELEIRSQVKFLGWVDQVQLMKLYSESDLFVLPSLAEGIPMVLMEAMAMEIPSVAPCITGIPELIEHGADGMLYFVADVEDLTAKVRTLLESPDLNQRIGKQARKRVLHEYDMAVNVGRFAELLRQKLTEPQWK